MPSYNKQTTISTYFVNKQLIESIEEFFENTVSEIINLDTTITQKLAKSIEIIIHDSHGKESYASIKQYKQSMFRNDVEGVSITYKLFSSDKDIDLSIRFGSEEENSDLSISFSGENPREKVFAIEEGFKSVCASNKTLNWILYPKSFIRLLLILGIAFCGIMALSSDVSRKESFLFGVGFWIGLICSLGFPYLKEYCSFDTVKQKQLDKWFSWLVMGLAAFILFSSVLTSVRKSILGF